MRNATRRAVAARLKSFANPSRNGFNAFGAQNIAASLLQVVFVKIHKLVPRKPFLPTAIRATTTVWNGTSRAKKRASESVVDGSPCRVLLGGVWLLSFC